MEKLSVIFPDGTMLRARNTGGLAGCLVRHGWERAAADAAQHEAALRRANPRALYLQQAEAAQCLRRMNLD